MSIIISVEGCLAVEAKNGFVNALTGGTVMADGFAVEVEEIRAHAATLEALRHRFGAIKSASASISSNDADYGMLCGWMAGILERRHQRQNQLFAYAEENLGLAADALIRTSREYADVDDSVADTIRLAGRL